MQQRPLNVIVSVLLTFVIPPPPSDLVYEEPHEGREGVMAWLEKVRGCL